MFLHTKKLIPEFPEYLPKKHEQNTIVYSVRKMALTSVLSKMNSSGRPKLRSDDDSFVTASKVEGTKVASENIQKSQVKERTTKANQLQHLQGEEQRSDS